MVLDVATILRFTLTTRRLETTFRATPPVLDRVVVLAAVFAVDH